MFFSSTALMNLYHSTKFENQYTLVQGPSSTGSTTDTTEVKKTDRMNMVNCMTVKMRMQDMLTWWGISL